MTTARNTSGIGGRIAKALGVTALLTVLFGAAPAAYAALIELDWIVAGDKALLQDMTTGIVWLDLGKTGNRSYNDVAANLGPGGDFDGFRFASEDQVIGLFKDAGIPDINVGFGGTAANVPGASSLMALWDADLWGLHDGAGEFGYFRTAELLAVGHNTGLLWVRPDGTAEATSGGPRIGVYGDDVVVPYYGSALVVRTTARVPEPGTLIVFGIGLSGLALSRRRGA